MVKNAALSIRIAPELKEQLEALADRAGISVASYVERSLKMQAAPPNWVLDRPELVHSILNGTVVKLDVAKGFPPALLAPEHAESLGRQLLHVVQVAAATPVGSRSRVDACVADCIEIAKGSGTREKRLLATYARINKFLADLEKHIKEWPNQDPGIYISKLEDALTEASTSRARTEQQVSDLLEKGIDHLMERRRKMR